MFAELNTRYQIFLESLPSSLHSVAISAGTFTGESDSTKFNGPGDLNIGLTGTPWLFWDLFSGLEEGVFLQLAEAGALQVLAAVILDHLVDEQVHQVGQAALLCQSLHGRAAKIFREVFTDAPWFWRQYERLEAEHIASYSMEAVFQRGDVVLSQDDFVHMASGKYAPILITVAAFSHQIDRRELLQPIEISIKQLAVASSLLDDIDDWEEDANSGHRTFFLDQVRSYPGKFTGGKKVGVDYYLSRLNQGWLDYEYLGHVVSWLEQSIQAVAGLSCDAWIAYIDDYRQDSLRLQRALFARHLARRTKQPGWKRNS